MSESITGIIQKIEARSVAGGKTAYNIVVGGQSYGAGLYAPKAKEGDYVKFNVDESRGYKNVERNSLKVSANKPPAEAVAAAEATAPKQSTTGGSFDTKQDTISRQSATNTAIAFLQLLSDNDALGLPATTTKKGNKQQALEAMLSKYTVQFYEENTGVVFKSIAPGASEGKPEEPEDEPEVEAPSDEEWS